MTRKDLSRIHWLNKAIENVNEMLAKYDDEHPTVSSPQITGMPVAHGVNGSKVENHVLKVMGLIEVVSDYRKELIDKQTEMMEFIRKIDDTYLQQIIMLYCIDDYSWNQVAAKMNTSIDAVRKYYERHVDAYLEKERA